MTNATPIGKIPSSNRLFSVFYCTVLQPLSDIAERFDRANSVNHSPEAKGFSGSDWGAAMDQLTVGVFDAHEIFAHGLAAILREYKAVVTISREVGSTEPLDVAIVSRDFIGHAAITCPTIACISLRDVAAPPLDARGLVAVLYRETITPGQLCGAVHAAVAGLRLQWTTTVADSGLDDRSRRVLRLLAEGAGTREISIELGYSERTVKSMIQRAEHALGARSRAQAVAVAVRGAFI